MANWINIPIDSEQVQIENIDNVPLSYWIQMVDHSDKFQSYDMDNFVTADNDDLLTTDIPTKIS